MIRSECQRKRVRSSSRLGTFSVERQPDTAPGHLCFTGEVASVVFAVLPGDKKYQLVATRRLVLSEQQKEHVND